MRIPLSWLRELVTLPDDIDPNTIAQALTKAGLEVEAIEQVGSDISGPLVIGKVVEFVEEPQKNGKVIRWCQVDVGEHNGKDEAGVDRATRGIICGAGNFAQGDFVVAALPGAVLPGDFAIAARKTYGHVSEGMLCAVDELSMGTDHSGIIVLPEIVDGHTLTPGEDAAPIVHLRDTVFVVELTPDQGYCLSLRGVAREVAQGLGYRFTDPLESGPVEACTAGFPVEVQTPDCPIFAALTVTGLNPQAQAPRWLQRRLQLAGMRSVNLAVDVTNYVMLATGQPLHAYDAVKLNDKLIVRQAHSGEKLTTLDGVERQLDPADLVIADAQQVVGLAGVMGGADTEVDDTTQTVVLEAACFSPVIVARAARRHNLISEASKRFERATDPAAPYAAATLAAHLLQQYGGATLAAQYTVVGSLPAAHSTSFSSQLPTQVLGRELSREQVIDALSGAGVHVTAMGETLSLIAPSWRPDLVTAQDYVEEVARKTGIDDIESVLPRIATTGGLTREQQARRQVAATLAAHGLVEVLTMPFIDDLTSWSLSETDPRSAPVRLANPLTAEKPFFRSTLIPGLLDAAVRNASRSADAVALFEIGRVAWHTEHSATAVAPILAIGQRPSAAELNELDASLPFQARHLGALWSGTGADQWRAAFAVAEAVAQVYGHQVERRAAAIEPFHPGRCAELVVGDVVVGLAGELHPQSYTEQSALPSRVAALEMDLDLLATLAAGPGNIGALSPFPVTKEDVALVVAEQMPAGEVLAALRRGGGQLLEQAQLFDVYRSEQLGDGKKSLAFALRFRAADRTLKQDEVTTAREAAIAAAEADCGASLRAI
ncbi:MAG: phenylalanine--tRNA ligase subunit beta [Propionibacteriaceae bacterium]